LGIVLTAAFRRRPLALLSIGAVLVAGACGSPPKPPLDAFVRLDQLGYSPTETKIAVLLAPRDAAGARAAVVGADGRTVLSLAVGPGRGAWNATFTDVRPIDLTALTRPGTYRVRIDGPVHAESPPFRVGTAAELFGPLARESVEYFQAHRDGGSGNRRTSRTGPRPSTRNRCSTKAAG
jgi:endoglucanase